jgi:hypothetical protein
VAADPTCSTASTRLVSLLARKMPVTVEVLNPVSATVISYCPPITSSIS